MLVPIHSLNTQLTFRNPDVLKPNPFPLAAAEHVLQPRLPLRRGTGERGAVHVVESM